MPTLFEFIAIRALTLPNRIVEAPRTRTCRRLTTSAGPVCESVKIRYRETPPVTEPRAFRTSQHQQASGSR